MDASPELLAALRREEIEQARNQTFAQKFLAGAELFDYACEIARAGIRMQHPDFDEPQILEELRRRLARVEPGTTTADTETTMSVE